MHFNLFYSFVFMFHTYYVIFCDIFALFLAQHFKTKVLTAQKNLLFECLRDITGYATLLITLNIKVNRAINKSLKEAAHHSRLKTRNITLHKTLHTTLRINIKKALHKDLVNPTHKTH